jgi:putative Holliday junction resolvase
MRWLSLDVGSRRVGVAVGSAPECAATALPAIPFTGAEGVAERVAALMEAWKAQGVVVGVPYTRRGQGRGERRAMAVVDALRERLDVPVAVADERGTTVAAERLLGEAGVPRRRWPDLVDSVAARLILEGFMTSQGGGGNRR